MVVGVDLTAQALGGERGDDLVGVHVGRGAGARLEHVDGEVLVPPAPGDLRRGLPDRSGDVRVQHPELRVDLGGGRLDPGQGLDVGALQPLSGDREVLHGPLGLGTPLGVRRDPHLTHRIVLDAVLRGA
ncbi:hypothetical protein ACVWXU_003696 [Streptomyces sp. TE33382]